jgi:hypothetical protein
VRGAGTDDASEHGVEEVAVLRRTEAEAIDEFLRNPRRRGDRERAESGDLVPCSECLEGRGAEKGDRDPCEGVEFLIRAAGDLEPGCGGAGGCEEGKGKERDGADETAPSRREPARGDACRSGRGAP